MTILGKGTFGCVVSPSLKCTDTSIKSNKRVSKIMSEDDALDEMKEYKELDKIPELKKYLLRFPELCKPVDDEKFRKAITQCKHNRLNRVVTENQRLKRSVTNNISSLLLENGGVSLRDFKNKFKNKLTINDFEIFLTSIKDLFQALIVLRKHKYVHQDIKANNIVYSPKTGKIALIDFGKLNTFDKIKYNSEKSINNEGTTWFNYPPEAKFMNRKKKILKNESEYQQFLKYTIVTWDSYSLALCLKDIISNNIHDVVKSLDQQKRIEIINFLTEADSLLTPYVLYKKLSDAELIHTVKNSFALRNKDLESLKQDYIQLLKDHKMYRNVTPKPSKEVIQIEETNSLNHIVNKTVEKKCKEGKEPHPISNRCVKKCKKGETRNSTGRCTSKKTNIKKGKTVKQVNSKKKTQSQSKRNKTSKRVDDKWYKVMAFIDANEYECRRK